ncbi:retinol dehydrogenase 14-like [Macrosteles quadrilineatus]|uniref:retinol dehydrogenase 14-like n=1 Tax=Macrosteles quadrilineatus TaxID=74068 RepID=UPI0023E15720|nr:retinol dehydrogenase 14-like [Macrosteles quadrilineatus]XP_054289152.1 retinol dehydrogenase 14-like [Macrosteles quadrilineatus]
MDSQKFNNFLHFYLFGPYYVLEDNLTARRCNFELGNHEGKIAVITGGHRGIGAFVTRDLLSAGFHVILGCRRTEDGKKFASDIRNQGITCGRVTVKSLDLKSLSSVRSFAEEVLKETTSIDLLINNAGIILSDYEETEDGFEAQWQVNYLSHFLLCHLLLPILHNSVSQDCIPRVVNVSSLEHKTPLNMDYEDINNKDTYNGMTAYGRSKLAQVMFTIYLNSKLSSIKSSVEVVAAHPGIVNTEIFDGSVLKTYFPFVTRLFFKTPAQGAKPIVYTSLYGRGGEYIGNCRPQTPSCLARDVTEQSRLFEESKKSLNITLFAGQF